MQGKKHDRDQPVTAFQLSSHIPKHNFYRRLKETLDLAFLYEHTKACYGSTGNPSIDPVVFFKLMLISYLENITSDIKLIEHCSMRMDILYFLGYNIDRRGQRMKRLRSMTVEPELGSLVEYHGLRKVNVRGKAGAHKVMLMAAVAFNLKKYMKFTTKSTISQLIALKAEWSLASQDAFWGFGMLFSTQSQSSRESMLIFMDK